MGTLVEQFRAVVCDLDGVVYAGPVAIDHAVDALNATSASGRPVLYATNNAARPPQVVAEHLTELGLDDVTADSVLNSSLAGAYVLAEELPTGSSVLAVGGVGVTEALETYGLKAVAPAPGAANEVQAVLQGYGPDVTAVQLAEAAYAVQQGVRWVATNTDRTLPTNRGKAPGNGTLVSAVAEASGVEPKVVGKPKPVMYDMAVERLGLEASEVVGIGDRLETDIEGATHAGCASILVLTGVHGYVDAVAAPAVRRPQFVVDNLAQLHEPYVVEPGSPRDVLGQLWRQIDAGELTVDAAQAQMRAALEQR